MTRIENWHYQMRCDLRGEIKEDRGTGRSYFDEVESKEHALTWRGLSWRDLTGCCDATSEYRDALLEYVSLITDEVLVCLRNTQQTEAPAGCVEADNLYDKLGLSDAKSSELQEDFRAFCLKFVGNLVCTLRKALCSIWSLSRSRWARILGTLDSFVVQVQSSHLQA